MIATRFSVVVLALSCCFVSLLTGCGDSDPKVAPKSEPPKAETPMAPLIEKKEVADWCKEHVVPESVCTRCNASLLAGFQAKGDWCKTHELPDSQCFACHPELEAKFRAMEPKSGG